MLVDVALPVPLPRSFAYHSAEPVAEGMRVRVPVAGRKQIGWVVGAAVPARELKQIHEIEKVLDAEPSVPPDLLRLCRWLADYYVTPLGVVLRSALPAVLSQTARSAPPAKTRRVLRPG